MTLVFLRAIAALAVALADRAGPRPRALEAGMVIDQSVTIRPGTYRLSASPDHARPAITIRGENITIDFNGAVLAGGPDGVAPDGYAGIGC